MENQMDSMGRLPQPLKSSEASTQLPALNVSLLGTDFHKASDGEVVSKQLYRLAAVFGDPWGKDASLLRQMANEWLEALADMPAATVERGVSEWVKTGDRWPKPSDIRKSAERLVNDRVYRVSEARKIHERRLRPTEAMLAFSYQRSPLRSNRNWDEFLDTVHPTLEHNYFVDAHFGDFEHAIFVGSEFAAEWLNRNCAEAMEAHFGRKVVLMVEGAKRPSRAGTGRTNKEQDAAGLKTISEIGYFSPIGRTRSPSLRMADALRSSTVRYRPRMM